MGFLRTSFLAVALTAVPALAQPSPFNVRLDGSTMSVYSGTRLIVTWRDYRSHDFHGDYIALLDTKNVSGVYSADGRTVVNNYSKTQQWWWFHNAVGLLDTDGIFDLYRLSDGQRLIQNWRDTVRVGVEWNKLVLLDRNGILDAYTGDGVVIVKNYKDAVDFTIRRHYVAIVDKNGIFDAYRPDATGLIRNWRDTVKYVARTRYIALLDRAGILQAYRVSDGVQALRQNGVTDIRPGNGGVEYLQAGVWRFFQL